MSEYARRATKVHPSEVATAQHGRRSSKRLIVGAADDQAERQADQMADRVTATLATADGNRIRRADHLDATPDANTLGRPDDVGRIRRAATKPKARAFSDKATLIKELEKSVDDPTEHLNGDVQPKALALYQAHPDAYCDLMLYKLDKHVGNPAKFARYRGSMPPASTWETFERAWARRNGVAVAGLAKDAWITNEARCKKFAFDDPQFFVDHFLLDGLRQGDAGQLILIGLTQEKEFIGHLKMLSPAAYGSLAAEIPVLRLVQGVADEVDIERKSGANVTVDDVVAKVFDAFINNRGMEVGYAGTKVDQNPTMLTGGNDKQTQARAEQTIKYKLPAKLSTACHELLHLLTSVLESYPGLEDITIVGADEPTAVLTVPLNTLAGGLIASSYTGNVFDADGNPTNQIFFSGDRAKISKSHSWLVINGIAYDPVLGTTGADVVAAIDGKFEFLSGPEDATEVGGTRTFSPEKVKKTSGAHGLNAGWRFG